MSIELMISSIVTGGALGAYAGKKIINYFEKTVPSKMNFVEKAGTYIVCAGLCATTFLMPAAAYTNTTMKIQRLEEEVKKEVENKNYDKAKETLENKKNYQVKMPLINKDRMDEVVVKLNNYITESESMN